MNNALLDPDRFARCLCSLGAITSAYEAFEPLDRAHADPRRAYHTGRHLLECFDELDRSGELTDRPEEVEAALWFHDAIYEPGSPRNEHESAEWARSVLAAASVRHEVIDRVCRLILATSHHESPVGRDAMLTVDIDLAILGQPPERFAEYDRQIRFEYAHIPDEAYRVGRLRVFEGFARRPRIYHTQPFVDRYEGPARANLGRAIEALRTRARRECCPNRPREAPTAG